jgi:hypothetical protein
MLEGGGQLAGFGLISLHLDRGPGIIIFTPFGQNPDFAEISAYRLIGGKKLLASKLP